MLAWKKILCPIDFSPSSRKAMELALELAARVGASVTLLHVYGVPAYIVPDGMVLATPTALAEIAATVDELLARWKKEAGGKVETKSAMGNAADEIVAGAAGFDAIVMGTHGRGGLKHALIGSVAEKVVRHAPIPVLTIRVP